MNESTSLYRRHRPGSFDEVVGQQHVVRTLRNAVEQEKVHHAYLFVGSRGTGKTSMAKILARSLNCERGGPTVDPCGECESCVTIASGISIDVIEMDAASNRSVDDVRDLRERVAYAPAGGRWKVYILDEAHMLTKEAWNAFLKTLEEPPPNTVFVLATTESHKVMATIADRCQRFDFQRPSLEQISEVLRRVAVAEGIEIEDGAVAMVARSASGSFRDALGTLDQLVSFGGSQVKLDAVLELLGAVDAELLFGAVDAIVAEDPKAVLLEVEKMAQSGRDPAQFARDLLAHLRHLLVSQTIGDVPESFVVTAADSGRLTAQAAAVSAAGLVRTIDELSAALTSVREGDDARMAVEIALLKAARPDLDPSTEGLLRRIERLEQKLGGSASPNPSVDGPQGLSQGASAGEDDEGSTEAAEVKTLEPEVSDGAEPESSASEDVAGGGDRTRGPETAASGAAADQLDLDHVIRVWPAMLDQLGKTAPALVAVFEGARPIALDGDALKVGFPTESRFNKRKAETPEKRELVAAALATVIGESLRLVFVLLEGEGEPPPAAEEEKLDEQELLARLKAEFNAEEVG
jgi:DNA polymerase-3 subunit gamma/tau